MRKLIIIIALLHACSSVFSQLRAPARGTIQRPLLEQNEETKRRVIHSIIINSALFGLSTYLSRTGNDAYHQMWKVHIATTVGCVLYIERGRKTNVCPSYSYMRFDRTYAYKQEDLNHSYHDRPE